MKATAESHSPRDSEFADWSELRAIPVDPKAILEEVVSALQILSAETSQSPFVTPSAVIDLHGALLVYELAGRGELIPNVSIGVSTRRGFERRVVSSARRLVGPARGEAAALVAWVRAAARIEDLVDLIDPELRLVVAS